MFKKGQLAYRIGRWNDGMTWSIRVVRVDACGKVKMILSDSITGACLGREFSPNGLGGGYIDGPKDSATIATTDRVEAERVALEMAEALRAFEIAMWERQIELNPAREQYLRGKIDALRAAEFEVISRTGLS